MDPKVKASMLAQHDKMHNKKPPPAKKPSARKVAAAEQAVQAADAAARAEAITAATPAAPSSHAEALLLNTQVQGVAADTLRARAELYKIPGSAPADAPARSLASMLGAALPQLEHSSAAKVKALTAGYARGPIVDLVSDRQYKVVTYLMRPECRNREIDATEIEKHTGYNVAQDAELLDALSNNERVYYSNGFFRYRPLYDDVRNIDDILKLINDHDNGVLVTHLEDTYLDAARDIQRLADEKKIYLLANDDEKSRAAYPRPQHLLLAGSHSHFKSLWASIKIPELDADIEHALRQAGQQVSRQLAAPVKRVAEKEVVKEKKVRKNTIMKNNHVAGVDLRKDIAGSQPGTKGIDVKANRN